MSLRPQQVQLPRWDVAGSLLVILACALTGCSHRTRAEAPLSAYVALRAEYVRRDTGNASIVVRLVNISQEDLVVRADDKLFQGTVYVQKNGLRHMVFHRKFRELILSTSWINSPVTFGRGSEIVWELQLEELQTLHAEDQKVSDILTAGASFCVDLPFLALIREDGSELTCKPPLTSAHYEVPPYPVAVIGYSPQE